MPIQIQFRRGTYSQWVAADPVLADGELAIQTDAGGGEQAMTLKIGDGATAWSSLAYGGLRGPTGPGGPPGGPNGPTGPVGPGGPVLPCGPTRLKPGGQTPLALGPKK